MTDKINITQRRNNMKRIHDDGQCGTGGYCNRCPHKRIEDTFDYIGISARETTKQKHGISAARSVVNDILIAIEYGDDMKPKAVY